MRKISSDIIRDSVKRLCLKANIELRKDVLDAIKALKKKESSLKVKRALDMIIQNAEIAKKKRLPICQDTGMVVVYLAIGQKLVIEGDIVKAVSKGVKEAYIEGYFRKSIVNDPFLRKNTNTNLPPLIYTSIIPGNRLNIRVGIKGFGCENASFTKMFRPTDPIKKIEDFILENINNIKSRACPPMYIGIGIGGTLTKAVSMSKEAIFRKVGTYSKIRHIRTLEKSLFKKINDLKIGPMGLKSKNSAVFGVSVLTYPTHIAGLPVAVNVSCHATRDAGEIL
ncbi:MAG: fumarate hydratase [Candidatus Omnitrophota bacterium]